MKTLIIFFAAFLFAFFIGCENTVTDPVDVGNETDNDYTATELSKDIASYYPKTLVLKGVLVDPSHPLNSTAEIKGILRYKIEKRNIDPFSPSKKYALRVSLYTQTNIYGGCNGYKKPWTVVFATVDVLIPQFVDPAWNLEKVIRVRGTCCAPLNIILRFSVDDKEVKLYSMGLKKCDGAVPVGDPAY